MTFAIARSVGSDAYDRKLSGQRAAAVRIYVVGKGIEAARANSKSRGVKKPMSSKATAQGRAQNRRVEIEVSVGGANP